jgi:hypothetical protein
MQATRPADVCLKSSNESISTHEPAVTSSQPSYLKLLSERDAERDAEPTDGPAVWYCVSLFLTYLMNTKILISNRANVEMDHMGTGIMYASLALTKDVVSVEWIRGLDKRMLRLLSHEMWCL